MANFTPRKISAMKHYTFKIRLENGNEMRAHSTGNSSHDAIDKVLLSDQMKEFVKKSNIESIDLVSNELDSVI